MGEMTVAERALALRIKEQASTVEADNSNLMRVTVKGFQFRGANIGMTFDAVVLDSIFENTYFDSPYDPDADAKDPTCWAKGRHASEMAPPAELNAAAKQSDACASCWAAEFGSASHGKGKACRNYRRIALLPWNDGNPDFQNLGVLRIPPTSLNVFNQYVSKVSNELQSATLQFVTRFNVDEDSVWPRITRPEIIGTVDPGHIADLLEVPAMAVLDNFSYSLDPEVSEAPPKKSPKATKKKRTGRSRLS